MNKQAMDLLIKAIEALKNNQPSRENSLAITNAQQALMWLVAGQNLKETIQTSIDPKVFSRESDIPF